jgi:hypothetical protein
MREREFVDALMNTIRKTWPESTVIRPSDSYTLGVPDVLAWIPPPARIEGTWSVAIEAKAIHPLMPDPLHRGRRIGAMLKHPFTGPQISLLRMLQRSSVDAFGLVRVSVDTAFRIEPQDIPATTGNFTHEELVKFGRAVKRENGLWRFWEKKREDQISGSGHRDDPGD